MADVVRCSSCGAQLDPPGPEGLCPVCLLKMGLAAGTRDNSGAPENATAVTPAPGRFSSDEHEGHRPIGPERAGDSPPVIGPYHLLQVLGEGGMGIVFLAEQREPIQRRVALKVIKVGMDSREVLARFDLERQALAMMDHPCIARVLDAGVSEQGRPYFAMEYVSGLPILEYCNHHGLKTRDRLALFVQMCQAIQHAHQKGIIHRDLKPSNVLVTEVDGKPLPKVIDFGIAKATAQHLAAQTLFTRQGALVGTPEYMSPEQADFGGGDVDTRTDIYALGLILYELLTGVLPFDEARLREAGLLELYRVIREEDPPKPSSRVTTAHGTSTSGRRPTPPTLAHELRGDLDWITLKALEKDRRRRYASASEFAADIERYLSDEPVMASPPSAAYRLRKTIRRHRVALAAAGLITLALAVGLAIATAMYLRSETSRREADRQRGIASQMYATAERLRGEADAQRGVAVQQTQIAQSMYERSESARAEAERQRQAADHKSYVATIAAADLLVRSDQTVEARNRLAQVPPASRGWEWHYLYAESDRSIATLGSGGGAVTAVQFTPNGERLVWVAERGVLRAANAKTHVPDSGWRRPAAAADRPESIVAVTHDGTTCLTVPWVLPVHGVVYVRVAGKPEGTEPAKEDVPNTRVFVSARMVQGYPAGKTPLSDPPVLPTEQRTLSIKRVMSGAAVSTLVLPIIGLAGPMSPSTLTSEFARGTPHEGFVGADRYPHLIRFVGRTLATLSGRQGSIVSAVFSADGRLVATWGWDNVLMVWDCANGALVAKLAGHQDGITQAVFNAAGSKIASASHDGTVRVWDIERAGDVQVIRGHNGAVLSAAFSPDGGRVVSGGADRTVRIWTTAGVGTATYDGHAGEVTAVTFSPDGRRVASGSSDKTIRIWNLPTGESAGELHGHTAEVTALDFSTDGSQLASGSADGTVKLWEARRGGRFVFPDPEATGRRVYNFVDLDAGLGRVVTDAQGNDLQWWSLDAPERFVTLAFSPGTARTTLGQDMRTAIIALAPNGREVLAASTDGRVSRWSLDTATRLPDIAGPKSGITGLAFSPDSTRIALISFTQRLIAIRPVNGGKAVAIPTGPEIWGNPRFSADGRLLAAHTNRVVAIWDARSGALVRELPPQPDEVTSIILSPNGRSVAAGSTVGTIRVWDVASGAGVATLAADAPGFSWPLAFDRAGARLVAGHSGGSDGHVRVWDIASSDVLEHFDIGNRVPSRSAFTPDGRTLVVLAEDGTVARFDARTVEDVEARQTVDRLYLTHKLSSEVLRALERDGPLAAPRRAETLRMVQARGNNPDLLDDDARSFARNPRQRPEDYQRAVKLAEAALLEVPQSAYYSDTLGLALYRVGRYRESIEAFRRAESLRGGPDLPGLFFLALAHDRLGEEAQAQAVANTIAAYAKSRSWSAWSIYEEGWWQEIREAAQASATKKKLPQR